MSRPHPDRGGPTPDPDAFRIRLDLGAGHLFLAGPLDRSTVHLLYDAISTLLFAERDAWVVDATQVTRCDSAGIRAIESARRRALRHHRRMQLIGGPVPLPDGPTPPGLDPLVYDGDDEAPAVPDPVSV